MQIKLLCQDSARLELLKRCAGRISGATLSAGIGNPNDVPGLLNGAQPDLFIIDGATKATLGGLASLLLQKPDMEAIVISSDTSPEFLMQAMRAGVREVIPAAGDPALLAEALKRAAARVGQRAMPTVEGKVFAFLSCKGGSGATFLATNIAAGLAETGRRVALIDLNLQFGDAAIFVSETAPPSNIAELAQQIHRLDATLLAASMIEAAPNFHVLAAPEDPAHGADVRREHVDAILCLARKHYDFVVVDVSRSLDAVSLQALDLADTIFLVLQLTLPYVRDGKRLLNVFRSLGYASKKIQLIVNRYEKGGDLTLKDLEAAFAIGITHTMPNSYAAAVASVNLGIPLIRLRPDNPLGKAMLELVRSLQPPEAGAAAGIGWLSRMLSRSTH